MNIHIGARSQTLIFVYLLVGIVGSLGFNQEHPIVLDSRAASPYRLLVEALFSTHLVQNAFVKGVVKFSWRRLGMLRWWSNYSFGAHPMSAEVLVISCLFSQGWTAQTQAHVFETDGRHSHGFLWRAGQGTGGLIVCPLDHGGPPYFLTTDYEPRSS